MADETKTNATGAASVIEPKVEPSVDMQALLAEKDAKIAKLTEVSENYRKGMLAAKGKLPTDGSAANPEDLDALVEAKVKAHIAETELFKEQQEKDELIAKTLRENKELKVALQNRQQGGASATTGGGQTTTEVKTEFFTPEQLADMERRSKETGIKIDPEKVKANLLKIKQGL